MNDREKVFADFLTTNNKTYISQPPRFKLKKTTYRTDFYCPEDNTYYEVVGTRQAFHSIKPKLREFIKTYPEINFKIVKPNGKLYPYNRALFEEHQIKDKFVTVRIPIDMKRVNFHLTTKQIEVLRKHAKRTGLKVAEIIRRAIDKYLNENK